MRRGLTHGVGSFVSMVLVTATRGATCLLCDVNCDLWGKHASSTAHIARSAICRMYVAPERHDSMMQQLWKHIRLDFGYIDDVTHRKEDHRRGRLASTMRHLRERGVLRHSIPQLPVNGHGIESLVVTKDLFVNFMLVGEGYAMQETVDRVARLMPRLDAVELDSVVRYILSKRRLAWLFDQLDMKLLLTREIADGNSEEIRGDEDVGKESTDLARNSGNAMGELPRLRQEEKAVIIFSCLGELQMYSRQDRSHSVATRAAAEQLVLNVLGTHVMENIIAELVHAVLQSVVEEGTPVWRAHCAELVDKMFEGTRATPPPLALSSTTREMAETTVGTRREADLLALYTLEAEASATLFPSTAGRRLWSDVSRALALELTVPNPVNKAAVFAPASPRLSSKKKALNMEK